MRVPCLHLPHAGQVLSQHPWQLLSLLSVLTVPHDHLPQPSSQRYNFIGQQLEPGSTPFVKSSSGNSDGVQVETRWARAMLLPGPISPSHPLVRSAGHPVLILWVRKQAQGNGKSPRGFLLEGSKNPFHPAIFQLQLDKVSLSLLFYT